MADQVNKESIVPNVTKDNEDNKLSLMTLNANKAGMEGLDTEKINQIIEEASKGSKFYQHKQKRYHFNQSLLITLFIFFTFCLKPGEDNLEN